MKTIRFETFETNSSSCHSLIVASKSDFEKFRNGEMVLHLGCIGVPRKYLSQRGWENTGGQDGTLLTWAEATDLYIQWLKEYSYTDSPLKDLQLMDGSIKTPDDFTESLFKKIMKSPTSCQQHIWGTFLDFDAWEEGYSDWGVGGESTWSENENGLIEMETNWRDG